MLTLLINLLKGRAVFVEGPLTNIAVSSAITWAGVADKDRGCGFKKRWNFSEWLQKIRGTENIFNSMQIFVPVVESNPQSVPCSDRFSSTATHFRPLLRPSHGLHVACRTLTCKKEMQTKAKMSCLHWNFSNIYNGLDFIKF